MFSSLSGFCLLNTESTPESDHQNVYRCCQASLGDQNCPELGTPGLVTDMSLSKSDRALEISKQDLEMEPWKLGMKLEQVTEALC